VLGGTFDPIHLGHLSAARAVRAAHSLDRVLLIPAATPPHKRGAVTGADDRLAMVRIAAASEPGLEASDLEIARGGISYTVDTLAELTRTRPGAELYFIIGEDTVAELPTWKDSPRIFELSRIVTVNRPGKRRRFERALFPRIPEAALERAERDRVEMEPVDIASREIRQAIREGKPFERLLPAGVGEYIEKHRLYGIH
jgi:nicotinate-nucleotide adenylyltransferase